MSDPNITSKVIDKLGEDVQAATAAAIHNGIVAGINQGLNEALENLQISYQQPELPEVTIEEPQSIDELLIEGPE